MASNLVSRYRKPFSRYRHDPQDPNSLSSDAVRAVLEDRSGMLWTGTFGGLDRLDRRTGQTTHYRHDAADAHSISSNLVTKLLEDHTGTLWVGTLAGLNRFDAEQGTFHRFQHDPGGSEQLEAQNSQFRRCSKIVMARCGWHLLRPEPARPEHRPLHGLPASSGRPEQPERQLDRRYRRDTAGNLWIGTQRGGLNRFDPASGPPPTTCMIRSGLAA